MKKKISHILLFLLMIFMSVACANRHPGGNPQINFGQLEPLLHKDNDTLYIINFWATWCKPCVKEIPDFERINAEYRNKNVKVILVSLDFPEKYDELVVPFVKNNQITATVFHLTDVDANKWIDKVDSSWSGAIPATLIYQGDFRKFHEGLLTYETLKTIVESKI